MSLDYNGDGAADVIVGAFQETVGTKSRQGRAYVFDGATGALLSELTTPNPETGAYFGFSVSSGDVNGDGAADVIVGAFQETVGTKSRQGRAYVFNGANGALLRELTTPNPQASAIFGWSVSSGDVNGDSNADIIVGASGETVGTNVNQGRAYVFNGANGALLKELTTPNPQASARFGYSVSSCNRAISIPTVTTDGGASGIGNTVATLAAQITNTGNENPELHVCWGTTDYGTITTAWPNNYNMGTNGAGTYYHVASSLIPGTHYYYRGFRKTQLMVKFIYY